MIDIVPLKVGNANVYILKENDSVLLIDTGVPKKENQIIKSMARHDIIPAELDLIILTHEHYDHVGSLKALQDVSEAKVIAHKKARPIIECGETVFPQGATGIGRFVRKVIAPMVSGRSFFAPAIVDMTVDAEYDLKPHGFDGKVIHTPGHSASSLSVVLDSGEAFVGDTLFNLFPIGRLFPPFADDVPRLLESWRRLLEIGPSVIYPGHGAPIDGRHFAEEAPKIMRRHLHLS
jgi:glyoxylase-like metal-dependent hydrolase (beta-lactamase superfamily II)